MSGRGHTAFGSVAKLAVYAGIAPVPQRFGQLSQQHEEAAALPPTVTAGVLHGRT
ncbi:hypothetical protein [Gordonia rubripertincta]|uniref:hypothetical protein n=1 Tax=Gordonia rubripertincta TaxID=36822 RepID=UPI0015FB1E14|nr:hypothetical protein [Gordonia rubripertincta]QMU19803.1 hypothetical protein H3V45_17280 [Gordonia rubripertincta]